jgi:hypothetical protein
MPPAMPTVGVGTVLISKSSTLGGPSFSSAIPFELDSGLQPLKLQGLKPLIIRSSSSGLKSRPPIESRHANHFQIGTVPDGSPGKEGHLLEILLQVPWPSFATNAELCNVAAARNHLQNPTNSDILGIVKSRRLPNAACAGRS